MTMQETTEPAARGAGRKIIGVADSDSFLKWLGATLDQLPATWSTSLLIARGTATPSADQAVGALRGTRFAVGTNAHVHSVDEIVRIVDAERPDVVFVATRGAMADVVFRALRELPGPRPVLVTGLPGISIPATMPGLVYRSPADLFVLHSKREVREFDSLAAGTPLSGRFALNRLPFLTDEIGGDPDGEVVFAAQALFPRGRKNRVALLQLLVHSATVNPEVPFVIKLRARPGEKQTHGERDNLVDLRDELVGSGALAWPENLSFGFESMHDHLLRARGFVSISSTAALEAIAMRVPLLLLTNFGVNDGLVNTVFLESGLLGSSDELDSLTFKHAREAWLEDNYFHAVDEDDWIPRLTEAVARRDAGELPEQTFLMDLERSASERAYARQSALGDEDRTPAATAWKMRFVLTGWVRSARRSLGSRITP
jgi:hypothetical protein